MVCSLLHFVQLSSPAAFPSPSLNAKTMLSSFYLFVCLFSGAIIATWPTFFFSCIHLVGCSVQFEFATRANKKPRSCERKVSSWAKQTRLMTLRDLQNKRLCVMKPAPEIHDSQVNESGCSSFCSSELHLLLLLFLLTIPRSTFSLELLAFNHSDAS